jgi:hypothetical protein
VIQFPPEAGKFSFRYRVQTGSGAHPASYALRTGALSLGVKRPESETDHLPPSIADVEECVELYLHSPNKSSWHGA